MYFLPITGDTLLLTSRSCNTRIVRSIDKETKTWKTQGWQSTFPPFKNTVTDRNTCSSPLIICCFIFYYVFKVSACSWHMSKSSWALNTPGEFCYVEGDQNFNLFQNIHFQASPRSIGKQYSSIHIPFILFASRLWSHGAGRVTIKHYGTKCRISKSVQHNLSHVGNTIFPLFLKIPKSIVFGNLTQSSILEWLNSFYYLSTLIWSWT